MQSARRCLLDRLELQPRQQVIHDRTRLYRNQLLVRALFRRSVFDIHCGQLLSHAFGVCALLSRLRLQSRAELVCAEQQTLNRVLRCLDCGRIAAVHIGDFALQ
jgi:hypothetical protein